MSIPPINKSGALANSTAPATKNTPDRDLKIAGIYKVKTTGDNDEVLGSDYGNFLITPSAFDESKTSNWVQHAISGQSDPVLQWTSSGARTITFDALVTKDVSSLPIVAQKPSADNKVEKSILGSIAGLVAKVKNEAIKGQPDKRFVPDLDISLNLSYYRSLLYPIYSGGAETPRVLQSSPPRVVLMIGRVLNNDGISFGKLHPQNQTWVVSDLKIRVTKMLPDLSPMEAIVSFTLVQYSSISTSGNTIFPSGD